jgi:hypothetical protein
VAAKERAPAKEKDGCKRVCEGGAGPIAAIFLVPIASKHKQAVAPQAAVVCYVHRDGSCKPY